jgi:hypothetical protein
MVMAWRSTMPTFTDASLIAAGLGLLIWSVVALDRSRRLRTIVGALAFFSFGLAVSVRYTSAAVLGVAAVFALIVCLRPKWKLGWSTLVWWAIASLPPILASLAYNAVYFDGPFSTGYNASTVQFSTSAISPNLRIMPGRLWQAMPVFVVGLAAIAVMIAVQIIHAIRSRSAKSLVVDKADTANTDNTGEPTALTATEQPIGPSPATVDRWIGSFLAISWAATWVMYSAYEWTANLGGGFGGGRAGGAPSFGAGGGPAMGGMSQPVYSTVRFYLPALGAIALLVAWLFTRMPAVIGVVALIALFAFGGHEFINTVNSQWASMSMGGGRGSMVGPDGNRDPGGQTGPGDFGHFDPSKCPNLPQMPQGGAPPGSGQQPQRQPGTGPGVPPNGPIDRGGITFDDNGCPILPGSASTTSTTAPTTAPTTPMATSATS